MGLRDLFRRKPSPPPPARPGRRFHDDRARMFDLAGTGILAEMLAMPAGERDRAWQEAFLDFAWTASVAFAEPQTFIGPDGFPYLRLNLPRPGPFDSQCLGNVAGDCLANGVGAAFFASPDDPPERPQYVLSFGVIDSLVRFDSPWGEPAELAEVQEDSPASCVTTTLPAGENILIATPSADYLPSYAAKALDRHLREEWGLAKPRIALFISHAFQPSRSLVIGPSRSELLARGATEEQIAGWMNRLFWFLPPSRGLMLMPDDWTSRDMTRLRELF